MADFTTRVRAELPSLHRQVYLNTGGAGPMPRTATAAIQAQAERWSQIGRMSLTEYHVMEATRYALKKRLAQLVGGLPSEIAITTGVTTGLNHVIWGIDWKPGDEVVTTNLEHPGLVGPLAVLARRRGVAIRMVELETGAESLEERVRAACGPRTRLVALSHVAWTTGAVMDVAGAARAAHEVGALVLVDGAQAAGAIPVDVRGLGVDAYSVPAQKWLLGPDGLAALWIAGEVLDRVDLTFTGIGSGSGHQTDGAMTPHQEARKFEAGMFAENVVPGWSAALDWIGGLHDPNDPIGRSGWELAAHHTQRAVAATRTALQEVGATVLTPIGHEAGLLAFSVPGVDAEAAAATLEAQDIVLRWVPHPRLLRTSSGFFTDDEDIRRLASAVNALTG
jgi:L-cysteine/cystine lyase